MNRDLRSSEAAEIFNSPETENEFLVSMIRSVSQFPSLDVAAQNILLANLESYECFGQIQKLVLWRIKQMGPNESGQRDLDFTRVIRAAFLKASDTELLVKLCQFYIRTCQLSFSRFRIQVLDQILTNKNFRSQVEILEECVTSFKFTSDRVLCLERAAVIYEKSLFCEAKVEPTYGKILEIDPGCIRALRFFKSYHTQASQWTEVTRFAERLLAVSTNVNEKQRYAHELAHVYLYNLNQPENALEILQEFCLDSKLDIKHSLVDCYERLNRHGDLLELLNTSEFEHESVQNSCILKIKMADLKFKLARYEEAVQDYRQVLSMQPENLLAHEGIINCYISLREPAKILQATQDLRDVVKTHDGQTTITGFIDKFQLLMKPQKI